MIVHQVEWISDISNLSRYTKAAVNPAALQFSYANGTSDLIYSCLSELTPNSSSHVSG